MRFLLWFMMLLPVNAIGQAVPGPTLPPPVSKIASGFSGRFNATVSTTIASGQTTSAAVTLKGFQLVGVVIPSAFTGTAITFLASLDCTNYFVLKNAYGVTTVSYTAAPSEFLAIAPADFAGVNCFKFVSGSSEGALRTLNYSTRGL